MLWLGGLRAEHMFIGLVLIPPVLLKLGSTGYRFVRYYAGAPAYREKGPPRPLLRLLAPVLVGDHGADVRQRRLACCRRPPLGHLVLTLHKARVHRLERDASPCTSSPTSRPQHARS